MRAVVEDALRQTVEIREGGSLSMFEAVVTTVLDKARRGDAKVLSFILALLRLIGLTAETPESTRSEPVTANDLEIIASYLRRYGGASSENAPDHAVDDQQNGALNEGTKP